MGLGTLLSRTGKSLLGGMEDDERAFQDEGDRRPVVVVDEGDIIDGVEEERGARNGKSRGRKAITGLLVLIVVGVLSFIGAWLIIGNGATRKAKVPVNGASGNSDAAVQTEEGMTRKVFKRRTRAGLV